MGSSGSGSFSDYPGTGKPGNGGGGGGSGGDPPGDRCDRAFEATLEDVELSDYFKSVGNVPPPDTVLRLDVQKRVVAITEEGLVVGNLPTELNYLAACITAGYGYVGHVTRSDGPPPIALVVVDFAPIAPK